MAIGERLAQETTTGIANHLVRVFDFCGLQQVSKVSEHWKRDGSFRRLA